MNRFKQSAWMPGVAIILGCTALFVVFSLFVVAFVP